MKTHTSKLASLPDELRQAADELLASKFKEPEVVKKHPGVETMRFPRRPSMLSFGAPDAVSPVTAYEPDPTENCIQARSLSLLRDYLERINHANSRDDYNAYGGYVVCKMVFRFYPIGDFRYLHNGDNWMARRYMQDTLNNLTLDVDLAPGMNNEQIEDRVMDYMDRLRVRFGGGAFEAAITDTRIDKVGGYGFTL